MRLFDLLKDESFAELDNAARSAYYNEHFYTGPHHVKLPSMELYHLKSSLSKADINDILEWYENGLALGADIEKVKNAPPRKWENKYGWAVSESMIKQRDALIKKEIEFRFKVVDDFFNRKSV